MGHGTWFSLSTRCGSQACRLGGTSLSLPSPFASPFSTALYLLIFPTDRPKTQTRNNPRALGLALALSVRVRSTMWLEAEEAGIDVACSRVGGIRKGGWDRKWCQNINSLAKHFFQLGSHLPVVSPSPKAAPPNWGAMFKHTRWLGAFCIQTTASAHKSKRSNPKVTCFPTFQDSR